MKKIIPDFMPALCFFSLPVTAQETASPEAQAFFQKAMSQINPRHIAWVKNTAKNANEKNLAETDVRNQASQYGFSGAMGNMDIEALAFLVMMQSAKDAQEDLKAIMARIKANNEQKKKMREVLAKMNEKDATISRIQLDSFKLLLSRQPSVITVRQTREKPVTKAELDNVIDTMKSDLDSLSELGEEQQLKMQMIMDRMTKAESVASNMMKKFSEVANSIIANMK